MCSRTPNEGQQKYSVVVLAYEKVRYPRANSTHSSLKRRNVSGMATLAGRRLEFEEYWYAPAARAIVKDEVNDPYRASTAPN